MSEVRTYSSRQAASRALAKFVATTSETATSLRGRYTLALAGGNSPREAYKLMGDEFGEAIDWQRIHVFWGDERMVPYEHPDNNSKMARETMLNFVPLSVNNVHRVSTYLEPEAAAAQYQQELRHVFGTKTLPRFDTIILGMGADGHTASLFPGTSALEEQERWVVTNYVEALNSWRITMTLPVLNAAANIVFFVLGADKAEALAHIIQRTELGQLLPAGRVMPEKGKVTWIVDENAAQLLQTEMPKMIDRGESEESSVDETP